MTALGIITIILGIGFLFFAYKYVTVQKIVDDYKSGTGRYGFYLYSNSGYRAYVYIKEIDRYTTGYSKIKLDRIEALSYKDTTPDYARDAFISLKKTDEIEWLESEDNIRKARKEKLLKISKLF